MVLFWGWFSANFIRGTVRPACMAGCMVLRFALRYAAPHTPGSATSRNVAKAWKRI